MKMLNQLTALLLGTAMLGSPLTGLPVTAAEVAVNSVKNYTLDALMQMNEAQINALTDLYLPGGVDYAYAVQTTQNFHELELELGKETFFVKLMDPAMANCLYLNAAAPQDGSGAAENSRVLSWAEAESLLGLPVSCMKDVTEGEAKGYLHVTVDLNAYGAENACKTYIMVQAKLRANENIADTYGMSIGGGKRITETDMQPHDAEIAVNTDREGFLARIAGWENASLSDCIILDGYRLTLLTPAKPYYIMTGTYLPYRVYLNGGTLNADEINATWKQRLQKGYAETLLEKYGGLDAQTCTVEKSGDCWLVTPALDNDLTDELYAVLKAIPEVQRIEAGCSYQTHGRVNNTSEYNLMFTVSGKEAPKPEDFPALTGVTITEHGPMSGTTKPTYYLTLASDSYADYFAAAKYLQTLDFAERLTLGFGTDGKHDDSAEASCHSSETVTLFDRSKERGSRTDFFARIAGWQNAERSACILLGDDELLTPDKPYQIHRLRFTPYCVYLKDGAEPDTDAILAKWKEMLLAAGYTKDAWLWDHYTCEVTAKNGGYQIVVPQDAYAGITLADCLMTFPAVQRIEAQFGYFTNDRPNQPTGYSFRFTKDGTEMPKAEDFPQLSGVQIMGDVPLTQMQTECTWYLKLESGRYEDYFEAAKYLQTLGFVHDLYLCYGSTELADDSEDAHILDAEPTVLFERTADAASPSELTRDAFFRCIASREQVLYDACIPLNENQLLTPNKPYTVEHSLTGAYCFTLRKGGTLNADAVLAKWKEMLKADGYPANALAEFTCEITESGGVYTVRTTQDGTGALTLADCLKTFPDVQRIGRYFGYRSDDFANTAGDFRISFRSEQTLTAADFPELDIARITGVRGDMIEPDGRQILTLNSSAYADYFAAVKYLQTLDFVHGLSLNYTRTDAALADEPQLSDTEMTVLFDRGDLNQDGAADVADAVLLARYLASDAEAAVTDQGLANADTDGDGRVRDDDLTVLLKRIAKKY